MKILAKSLFLSLLLLSGCGNHTHKDQPAEADSKEDPNQALYDQVMAIHDEVMPKSDQIYIDKKALQDKIAKSADLSDDRKKQLEAVIAQLDSADRSMMDWMHKFKPMPDSVNQELAREYLENEMEKIKKVGELINESLQKAKEELAKK